VFSFIDYAIGAHMHAATLTTRGIKCGADAHKKYTNNDDAAEGILLAAERYDDSDPVNLGSGEETTIRDLAHRVAELTGYNGEIRFDASKPDGQPRRCLDVSRARARFGFKARIPFDDGLAATVRWYDSVRRSFPDGGSVLIRNASSPGPL
jgi:nucleoside-diphosphate-sugar epimerase